MPSARLVRRQEGDKPDPTSPDELKADSEPNETSSSAADPESTTSAPSKADSNNTSDSSKPTSTSSTSTKSAEQPWETPHEGSMQVYNDKETTIAVVGTSSGFTFKCPKSSDSWKDVTLGKELNAKVAEGAGCYMEYIFTGDSIQLYGTTGIEAGIFGCFVTTPQWNATGWWDAGGGATLTNAYQGSCILAGLGFGEHTVRLTNSPQNPKKVYFTGLRYTKNETRVPWAAHELEGCCPEATWPDGKVPTVQLGGAAGNATADGTTGSVIAGMSNGSALFLIMAVIIVISLASILLFAMCCKRRPASGTSAQDRLQQALQSKGRSHSSKARSRSPSSGLRRRRRRPPSPSPEDGTAPDSTTGSETTTDDEKDGNRAGSAKGRKKRENGVNEDY
ncbi:hypothetical protein JCM16303_006624 [Sporobolomyces ruberrimus]